MTKKDRFRSYFRTWGLSMLYWGDTFPSEIECLIFLRSLKLFYHETQKNKAATKIRGKGSEAAAKCKKISNLWQYWCDSAARGYYFERLCINQNFSPCSATAAPKQKESDVKSHFMMRSQDVLLHISLWGHHDIDSLNQVFKSSYICSAVS